MCKPKFNGLCLAATGSWWFSQTDWGDGMKLRVNATALVAAATLSLGAPAAAATVPIDYTLSASQNGITVTFGTMILDYDGSAFSLESLVLSVPKRTTVVTSDVTLSPVPGSSDYCLYTFLTCSIVPEKKLALCNL
jgi:hypothetical protein